MGDDDRRGPSKVLESHRFGPPWRNGNRRGSGPWPLRDGEDSEITPILAEKSQPQMGLLPLAWPLLGSRFVVRNSFAGDAARV